MKKKTFCNATKGIVYQNKMGTILNVYIVSRISLFKNKVKRHDRYPGEVPIHLPCEALFALWHPRDKSLCKVGTEKQTFAYNYQMYLTLKLCSTVVTQWYPTTVYLEAFFQ